MVELEVELLDETALAWLVEYEGAHYWVPKSFCTLRDGELKIPEWLMIDKGMV